MTLGFTLAALLAIGQPAAADPVRITSGFLTVSGAQDFSSRGFLRSIRYDFSSETFRLMWSEADGVTQNVFAPRLVVPSVWTPSDGPPRMVAPSAGASRLRQRQERHRRHFS